MGQAHFGRRSTGQGPSHRQSLQVLQYRRCGTHEVSSWQGRDDESQKTVADVIKDVGFKPFYFGPIQYARNLEAIAELWIHILGRPNHQSRLGFPLLETHN